MEEDTFDYRLGIGEDIVVASYDTDLGEDEPGEIRFTLARDGVFIELYDDEGELLTFQVKNPEDFVDILLGIEGDSDE
jgi:hypothetical protein